MFWQLRFNSKSNLTFGMYSQVARAKCVFDNIITNTFQQLDAREVGGYKSTTTDKKRRKRGREKKNGFGLHSEGQIFYNAVSP